MRRFTDDLGDLALVLFVGHRPRPIDAKISGRFRIELRAAFFHGVVQVDYRRQFLIFNSHEVSRVLRDCCALRDHHRDRIADMHHFLACQRRPERHDHLGTTAARYWRMSGDTANIRRLHVLGREHGQHVLGFAGFICVDRCDARVRVRRPHESGVGRIWQPRVVHETAGTADKGIVLDARRGVCAGGACGHGRSDNALAGPCL